MTNPINVWHKAKSGHASIRLHELPPHLQDRGNFFEVYALDGHNLLPRTKRFKTYPAARDYANDLWRSL